MWIQLCRMIKGDGSKDVKNNEGGEGVENVEEVFTNPHTSLGEGQHRLFSGKVHRE